MTAFKLAVTIEYSENWLISVKPKTKTRQNSTDRFKLISLSFPIEGSTFEQIELGQTKKGAVKQGRTVK